MRSISRVLLSFSLLMGLPMLTMGGCPFQNPFWFVGKPSVSAIVDENGDTVPDRVRVRWTRVENFKCVDYFQVEYFQRSEGRVQLTERIHRDRRSVDVPVEPCTEYLFKVIASEDWKGMREDFKMFSDTIAYRLSYTPKFVFPPVVKERRLRQQRGRRAESVELNEDLATSIRVVWRLSDIDYPICLSSFVVDHFDRLYNESGFQKVLPVSLEQRVYEIEVASFLVPCESDFDYLIRAIGANNDFSVASWRPPSCPQQTSTTTEIPEETTTTTTTTESTTTTEDWRAQMSELSSMNARLRAKIKGLNGEYHKIGIEVFRAFRNSVFGYLHKFLKNDNNDHNQADMVADPHVDILTVGMDDNGNAANEEYSDDDAPLFF